MRTFTILLLAAVIACGTKSAEKSPSQDATIQEQKESISLHFPKYGVFIHNWPEYWTLADHGSPCKDEAGDALFMILSGSAIIGTVQFRHETHPRTGDEDATAPLVMKSREVIFNGNLDMTFEPYGDPSLKVIFSNFVPSQEQFLIDNLSKTTPKGGDVRIVEISVERLPLYVPSKNQTIDLQLNIKPQKTTSTDTTSIFELWVSNRSSRIGGVCELDMDVKGKLKSSLNRRSKILKAGDTVTISNFNRSKSWMLTRTGESIVVRDLKKNTVALEVPVPGNYEWTFVCSER